VGDERGHLFAELRAVGPVQVNFVRGAVKGKGHGFNVRALFAGQVIL